MPKFKVSGIYVMKFFVAIDEEIEAEDELEAIELVQDKISAGDAYQSDCEWFDSGPEVSEED